MSESTNDTPNKDEVIEDAKESYEEARGQQEQALEQISAGEEFQEHETATLGELEFKVKRWVSKDLMKQIQSFDAFGDSPDDVSQEDVMELIDRMDTVINILDSVTVNETYDVEFWESFYERYGPVGVVKAWLTLLTPAIENTKEQGEALGNLQERIGERG